jgi:acetyltransferase
MRPEIGLNATFARGGARPGPLGLVLQSGAICTALLDWARPNDVGFSSVISLGASADLDFGEIVDYLAEDPKTEHILLYVEGIRAARRFLSALRAAARVKPVILLKSGRHPTGARAAVSHTGALVGADDVFDAAVRRAGAVRVWTVGQLVATADALVSRVRPRGDRLAVVTNGGGPGVLVADRAAELGIRLAELSSATIETLKNALPPHWSHGNPIDLLGDADAARYDAAVAACLADPGVDGALAILAPLATSAPAEAARAVIARAQNSEKPLLTCWMGEEQALESRKLFRAARIPTLRTPEPAVELFAHVSSYYRNQRLLLETPGPLSDLAAPDLRGARVLVETALAERRKVLSEAESKALLAAFHIPIAHTVLARSAAEAIVLAQELGFPVAMKIDSPDITHKSDVGGVRLGLGHAEAVRAAYQAIMDDVRRRRPEARVAGVALEPMVRRPNGRELMVGVIRDPMLGPAIVFGAGGTAVEVLADRAVALPPLNAFLAAEMIRVTRVSRLLGEFRGMPPVALGALESALLRVSEMACELPWIRELDINPLITDETGVIAADARIVIDAPRAGMGRYGHMAIHPYPMDLVSEWRAPDGTAVTIRPIRPEDAELEREFVKTLSPEAKYFRFMGAVRELTPMMLARLTQIDYDREMALVAVLRGGDRQREVGVSRYFTNPDGESCEFAVAIADDWQRRGLGRRLMLQLVEIARGRGLKTMVGHISAANQPMLAFARALGFAIGDSREDPALKRATLVLG